jgi:hypothetical protein
MFKWDIDTLKNYVMFVEGKKLRNLMFKWDKDTLKNPPVVNFINILHALFSPISFPQKITKPKLNREKLPEALSYENARLKC